MEIWVDKHQKIARMGTYAISNWNWWRKEFHVKRSSLNLLGTLSIRILIAGALTLIWNLRSLWSQKVKLYISYNCTDFYPKSIKTKNNLHSTSRTTFLTPLYNGPGYIFSNIHGCLVKRNIRICIFVFSTIAPYETYMNIYNF